MGIPVVDEILSFFQGVMNWILGVLPPAVKFMLFIFFIALIGGAVFPLALNSTGTFCLNGNRYDHAFYDFPTNIDMIYKLRQSQSNVTGTRLVESGCVFNDNTTGTLKRYYNGVFCTTCSEITSTSPELRILSNGNDNLGFCTGDAHRKNATLWQCHDLDDNNAYPLGLSRIASNVFACTPPIGYYYDQGIGGYKCEPSYGAACGNLTEEQLIAVRLINSDFTTIPTVDAKTVPVGVKCDVNTPRLAVFGIDIFSLQLWLLITVLAIALWLFFKFRR